MTRSMFVTNHVACLDDRPLESLDDAELAVAIQQGRGGALTEEATRLAMRRLGITDRARVMPTWWNHPTLTKDQHNGH